MTRLALVVCAALATFLVSSGERPRADGVASGSGRAEVVVLLESPPLAEAPDLASTIDAEQRAFRHELAEQVPSARIGWRYRLVANGFSVSVPTAQVPSLSSLPEVREVLPSATYSPQLTQTPQQIGAPAVWGPTLDTAGQGIKIGIIDSGIDQSHPFFDPTGYAMPAGFPKGQQRFTTAKVIVARAFPPKGLDEPGAQLAFDPDGLSHGTLVAGVAAGNADTRAGSRVVSGVAPRAYLGNYKVFVQAVPGTEANANSPAIVAAIEAAVADGMDVINFSGGEPEIEPSRDIVARALDAAAAAGVVPVVAAGNENNDVGAGSVSSPANSAGALAVAAVAIGGSPTIREHAEFSSVGPTPISLRLKPDVAAPGVDVLSSVPGGWGSFDGTSLAAPHVAGAAALLAQRHPDWAPAEIRSALVQSGTDAVGEDGRALGPLFQGGGVISLARADQPLLFAEPTGLSFGLMTRSSSKRGVVRLIDAGGAGTWRVATVRAPSSTAGGSLVLPASVEVPGQLTYEVVVPVAARLGNLTGYIELRRGTDVRRVPFWGRVSTNALVRHQAVALVRPGLYRGTTVGQRGLVSRYRYPETPRGMGVTTVLRGPERVYRFVLTRRVANFGVVVTQREPGSGVEPRIVQGFDENRLTGLAGLPVARNPYLEDFITPVLVAGALSPVPGEYAVVFDSAMTAGAGSFRFRFWVDDVTPPSLRLQTRTVVGGRALLVSATDRGSGVYADSIIATIDGQRRAFRFRGGVVSVSTNGLTVGTHRLTLRVSDYQESKNTENVARILPNTRTLTTSFQVR